MVVFGFGLTIAASATAFEAPRPLLPWWMVACAGGLFSVLAGWGMLQNRRKRDEIELLNEQLRQQMAMRADELASARNEVMEATGQFRAIFDQNPLGLALISNGQHVEQANARFREFFGEPQALVDACEWIGQAFAKRVPPTTTVKCARPDGTPIWTHLTLAELAHGGTDTADRHVLIAEDTSTEQAQALELEEAYQRLQLATEAARLGIWYWTLADDHLDWDDGMFEIFGFAPEVRASIETSYSLWSSCLHPDDREEAEASVHISLDRGVNWEAHYRIVCPDGAIRHVEAESVLRRDEGGKIVGVLGVCRDMTVKVELEAALSASKDEAVQANLAKDRLLVTMSHELRTPMNAINGLLEALQNTQLDEVQRSLVVSAHGAAKALLRIVNDMLDLKRLKLGALDIVPKNFLLSALINRIGKLYEVAAHKKNLRLSLHIAEGVAGSYVGDALRLGQILNNLLDNAIKFTDEGEVTLDVQQVTTPEREDYIRFEVRDTGTGIAPEISGQLFQPFVRADAASMGSNGGSGLGLSISRRLAHAMQGDLDVVPNKPHGSCFWLEVPLRRMAGQLGPASLSVSPEKTLIIEAGAGTDRMVAECLADWGFAIDVMYKAEAALAALLEAEMSEAPYRLVLIDWDLLVDERTLLINSVHQAMRQGKLRRVPTIIMVTPDESGEDADELTRLALAPDAVLTRPVNPSQLHDVITDLQRAGYTERADFTDLLYRMRPIDRVAHRRGARLLVVEDNLTNQFVASALLEQMGMIVDIASNGREALRKLANEAYDLVFMDVHMPVMNGLEATRAIRETPHGAQLPVVAMTAAAYPEDRAQAALAGMNDFLSKPVDPQRLASVLLRWLPLAALANQALTALALPGFDISGSIDRLGSEALLRRVLAGYNKDFADWELCARTAWQANDLSGLRQLAHALKGGSSSAGAVEAEQAAAALKQALRGGTSIDEGQVAA